MIIYDIMYVHVFSVFQSMIVRKRTLPFKSTGGDGQRTNWNSQDAVSAVSTFPRVDLIRKLRTLESFKTVNYPCTGITSSV